MTGIHSIADKAIEIRPVYPDVQRNCEACRGAVRADRAEGLPARQYSDAYLETLAVCRKIAERMPAFETALLTAQDGKERYGYRKSKNGRQRNEGQLWEYKSRTFIGCHRQFRSPI